MHALDACAASACLLRSFFSMSRHLPIIFTIAGLLFQNELKNKNTHVALFVHSLLLCFYFLGLAFMGGWFVFIHVSSSVCELAALGYLSHYT